MKQLFKSKSTKIVITILLCIFSLFCLSTIAYSAFSSTINITGIAHSRVEVDFRITNFTIYQTNNATSSYEEFSKNTVTTEVNIPANAAITYLIEITNYGQTNIALYSINGLSNKLEYTLENQNLKEVICDDSGKCNNFAVKNIRLTITSTENYTGTINLNLDFRPVHIITYKNLTGNYLSSIISGESVNIDLSNESPEFVYVDSDKYVDYKYENNILYLNNILSDIVVEAIDDAIYEYNYTGSYQTFTVPYTGVYKIELWGGQGGSSTAQGAYTSGNIRLEKSENLYVYVGEHPTSETSGYNGGGNGRADVGNYSDRAGGGATDIRLTSGTWNNFDSLKSRIMVAAGGGGESHGGHGAPGGGLEGFHGIPTTSFTGPIAYGYGATQTSGGTKGNFNWNGSGPTSGTFGIGGNGNTDYGGGGGGGYYGGGGSGVIASSLGGGGSGSSFVSGHTNCNAIGQTSTSSNIIHTDRPNHYSGKVFTNTQILSGKEIIPSHDGKTTQTGNTGHGYAKITLLAPGNKYEIIYRNINGNYQKYVNHGSNLIINFGDNAPSSLTVLINDQEIDNYNYSSGTLTINNVTGKVEIAAVNTNFHFTYAERANMFIVPYTGIYKVELWGAQGGGSIAQGAYVKGNILLTKDMLLYIHVGSKPISSSGGYNGGGPNISASTSGGGATDIRLIGGTWNNFDGLKSRIMVASGGGGDSYSGKGAPGGTLNGNNGIPIEGNGNTGSYTYGYGATQIAGGKAGYFNWSGSAPTAGSFGQGGAGNTDYGGGGGSGYYGGGGSGVSSASRGGAASGSSFISGHTGCNAISSSSTSSSITHLNTPNHYSGYVFINTEMIDGSASMPNYDGDGTMIGNSGNGHAKLTIIEFK